MLSFYQRKNLYEPQMSVAPNMTSAKTGQAVYGGSQPQTSWTSKYTTTPTIVPSWTQSAPVKPATQQPQMSVAPKTIEGSGMTSQFASNPTNYKPRQVAPPPPRVPPPAPTQKQVTPADTYLQKLASLNAQRTNQINQGTDSYEQKVMALDERQRQRNLDRIPQLQEGYNKYVQNVRDTIKGEEQATAESEEYTKEQYGSAMRKSARDKRLQDANLMNMFAGLGTLDSSAFQDIQTNRTNDFVMANQSTQREQAREVAGLRRGLDDFRRQAEQGIIDEESNLQARIAEIQNTVDQNSFQYDQLISQAIQEAQGRIGAIEDAYLGQEYAVRQKEYELTQAGTEKLSQMFLQTGEPQNQSDYEWMINNPDKYKEAFQAGSQPQLSATQENKVQLANSGLRALNEIERIFSQDPNILIKSSVPGQLGAREYSAAAFRAVEGLLRARSGAAIPETEVRRYMDANLPKIGDSSAESRAKLAAFRQDLEDVARSGGTSLQTQNTQAQSSQAVALKQAGFTDQEIREYLGG